MGDECLISILNGKNYMVWKFRMELFLKAKGLFKVVAKETEKINWSQEKKKEFKDKDKQAKAWLSQLVDDDHLKLLITKKTSFQMWEALALKYEKTDSSDDHEIQLKRKLLRTRLKPNSSLDEYLSEMDKIFAELNGLGCPLDDLDAVLHVLANLPDSYETLRSNVELAPQSEQTLEILKSKLKAYESLMQASKVSVKSDEEISKNEVTSNNRCYDKIPKLQCRYCKKYGHIIKDCRNIKSYRPNHRYRESRHQERGHPYSRNSSCERRTDDHRRSSSRRSREIKREEGTNTREERNSIRDKRNNIRDERNSIRDERNNNRDERNKNRDEQNKNRDERNNNKDERNNNRDERNNDRDERIKNRDERNKNRDEESNQYGGTSNIISIKTENLSD